MRSFYHIQIVITDVSCISIPRCTIIPNNGVVSLGIELVCFVLLTAVSVPELAKVASLLTANVIRLTLQRLRTASIIS